MKKLFFFVFVAVLTTVSVGQNINGRITSSVYSFQRFNTLTSSDTYLRAYQTVYLNINKANVSLRTRVNFEGDIVSPLDNDPKLRFYNLYIEARKLFKIATVKIGRQSLFNSVAGGLFDGVNFKLKFSKYSLTAYYGGNVPAYQKLELTDNWGNDFVLGGKLNIYPIDHLLIGLSYVNKNFKPVEYTTIRLDKDLNPINYLIQKNSNQFEFLSGKVNYELKDAFRIYTKLDYDLNFTTISKFEISGRYQQSQSLGISVYYNFREPRIRYNSIFSVFNYGNSKEIEGGLDYKINKIFTVIGKFGNVTYKSDNSQRLTLGVNSNYGSINYRKTFGYAGELDAVSIFGARSFLEGFLTPSIGLAYTSYKLSSNAEKNSIVSLLTGLNVRPWKYWSCDLQGQFFNNKIYKNDFRLFFKINHWFNSNLNIF